MSDRTIKRIKIDFSNEIRKTDEKICGNLMYFFIRYIDIDIDIVSL